MKKTVAITLQFLVFAASAAVVHVYEQTEAGGVVAQISDATLDTGRSYATAAAPAKSGYIFTYWTISTSQAFTNRDAWGRAYDSAPYTLYEDTTLTAHYLPVSQDSDNDGIADGHELYWYGGLAFSPDSDTDNDGFTFAQEIARGTNPLFPERHEDGPIAYADGVQWLYNPYNCQPYTLRSEPEGALYATVNGKQKTKDGALNGALIQRVLAFVAKNQGVNRRGLASVTALAPRSLDRLLSALIKQNVIERRGSKKTGGYYLREQAVEK